MSLPILHLYRTDYARNTARCGLVLPSRVDHKLATKEAFEYYANNDGFDVVRDPETTEEYLTMVYGICQDCKESNGTNETPVGDDRQTQ